LSQLFFCKEKAGCDELTMTRFSPPSNGAFRQGSPTFVRIHFVRLFQVPLFYIEAISYLKMRFMLSE
jgi:hypothetical protein